MPLHLVLPERECAPGAIAMVVPLRELVNGTTLFLLPLDVVVPL
jgi:hypothetical protein